MIRKLILSAGIATATLCGVIATPASASAEPIAFAHHRYTVEVRCGHHWEVRGTYHSLRDAEHAAQHLRHHGYAVRVERC